MDLATTDDLGRVIGPIEAGGDLIVDLTDVQFMDLHALRVLERLAEQIGRLTIANARENVRRLLDLTGFSYRPDVVVLPS
jgi:anti-anti-sigma factor